MSEPEQQNKMKFYYIRHGHIDKRLSHLWKGRYDTPINESGIKKVQESAQYLKEKNIGHIFSSPCIRTIQTAEIISHTLNIPYSIEPDLIEWQITLRDIFLWGISKIFRGKIPPQRPLEIRSSMFTERVKDLMTKCLLNPTPPLIVGHNYFFKVMRKEFTKIESGDCHPFFHSCLPCGEFVTFIQDKKTGLWSISPQK